MALNSTSSTTSLEAKHKRFEDDLLTWLERHGCHVRDKVAFDQACRSQCVSIQVGRLANHMIREELARDRRKASLSPALILTQRKRADILSRLMNGVSLVEDEQDVFQTIHSPNPSHLLPLASSSSSQQQIQKKKHHQLTGGLSSSSSSALSSAALQQQSMTKTDIYMLGNTPSFTPKWDHYNTMRSRWKYLQPQVRHLVEEDNVLAPATSTSYLKLGQVQLGGSYVDIQHFQSTVKAQNSKSLSIAARSMMLEQERQRTGTKR
eukprot:gene9113-10060_t